MNSEINWLAIAGEVSIKSDGFATSEIPKPSAPPAPPTPSTSTILTPVPPPPPLPLSQVKSNINFNSGEISFDLKLGDIENNVSVLLGSDVNPLLIVVGSFLQHAYNITFQGQTLAQAGVPQSFPIDKWVNVNVIAENSNVTLKVNGVRVCQCPFQLGTAPIGVRFIGYGKTEIKNFKVNVSRQKAFVVMQFSEEFNSLYNNVIKPICKEFDLEAVRADDEHTNGLIIHDILRSIQESYVILADITPDNPNVFYEVGYAHALNKPVILLRDNKKDKLPFDLSGFRTLFYKNSICGKNEIEEQLRKHLKNIHTQTTPTM